MRDYGMYERYARCRKIAQTIVDNATRSCEFRVLALGVQEASIKHLAIQLLGFVFPKNVRKKPHWAFNNNKGTIIISLLVVNLGCFEIAASFLTCE